MKNADFSEGKLEQLEAVRKEVFGLLGKPYDAKDAVPFLAFVAESFDYTNHLTNETIPAADCDFLSRVLFLGGIHKTYPAAFPAVPAQPPLFPAPWCMKCDAARPALISTSAIRAVWWT